MSVTSFRIYSYAPRKQQKNLVKIVVFAFVILAVLFEAFLYGFVVYQGRQFQPQKSDVLIVLGCTIVEDKPGVPLQNRLDQAVELFQQGYGQQIIVSGGQGKDEAVSEALVMKTYLLNQGIPEEKIILEDRSTSTRENIRFSKQLMEQLHYTSAVVVTNDYHIYRGVLTANRAGIRATGAAAPTGNGLVHFHRFRETFAILYYWIIT